MTDIISKIHDDMEEYELLCKKYNEKVVWTKDNWGNAIIDCYGEHADSLRERNKEI